MWGWGAVAQDSSHALEVPGRGVGRQLRHLRRLDDRSFVRVTELARCPVHAAHHAHWWCWMLFGGAGAGRLPVLLRFFLVPVVVILRAFVSHWGCGAAGMMARRDVVVLVDRLLDELVLDGRERRFRRDAG